MIRQYKTAQCILQKEHNTREKMKTGKKEGQREEETEGKEEGWALYNSRSSIS
jgi:hypothetical protein